MEIVKKLFNFSLNLHLIDFRLNDRDFSLKAFPNRNLIKIVLKILDVIQTEDDCIELFQSFGKLRQYS
jgi:hypothetical protein